MLKLGGQIDWSRNFAPDAGRLLMRLSDNPERPRALRSQEAFLIRTPEAPPSGFKAYVAFEDEVLRKLPSDASCALLPGDYAFLGNGDIVRLDAARREIRVLFRRGSRHNSFLTTEQCNHYCLMCSQPPKNVDDAWLADEIAEAIPLIDPETPSIGITGGEPTLLGDRFLRILRRAKSYLPQTAVHVLSNGRRFADLAFAHAYAEIEHPNLMVGIPLYSDLSTVHDYVVQSDGAFDGTLRGILNLKRLKQRVELRFVLHKQTVGRLPQLAEFIARNLTFVDHVALMGLEMTGFTRANLPELWIDPFDYQSELYEAATTLVESRINLSIYNHQLCLIDRRLGPFARKSISDWKNEYMPECAGCSKMSECGGFFSSAKLKYSGRIRPFAEECTA